MTPDAAPRRRLLLQGQLVEVWEDPQLAFGWSEDHLEGYIDQGAWVALFNAVMLRAAVPQPALGS
jgi:hypothetical protein